MRLVAMLWMLHNDGGGGTSRDEWLRQQRKMQDEMKSLARGFFAAPRTGEAPTDETPPSPAPDGGAGSGAVDGDGGPPAGETLAEAHSPVPAPVGPGPAPAPEGTSSGENAGPSEPSGVQPPASSAPAGVTSGPSPAADDNDEEGLVPRRPFDPSLAAKIGSVMQKTRRDWEVKSPAAGDRSRANPAPARPPPADDIDPGAVEGMLDTASELIDGAPGKIDLANPAETLRKAREAFTGGDLRTARFLAEKAVRDTREMRGNYVRALGELRRLQGVLLEMRNRKLDIAAQVALFKSAKESFTAGRYEEALGAIRRCEDSMDG